VHECRRERPREWSAALLTRWPATAELTEEQRNLMDSVIEGYIDDVWSMCTAHRRKTKISTFRLNGEPKVDLADHRGVIDHRLEHNWSAHVASTRPDRDGAYRLRVELYPGRTEGYFH
jgi:hypothetical protein